ncbi:MAG TPA: DUF2079 domain-containing protein [Acidimicrobiia bacterium]|jgi:uncharacterized membrane protein|nr:DUF2079 domain-containing protein [Acidimicrobiia bacterium]
MSARRDAFLPWILAALLALVWTVVACVRWRITYARSVDLGYFDHAAWLIRHGKPLFITDRGLPLLADHFSPIIYPIALVTAIVPAGLGLLVFQSIALGLLVVPVWFIARRHGGLEPRLALVVVALVALFPACWNLALSGFHPEVAMVPVIPAAILALLERRWVWFGIACGGLLATKEDFALLVLGLGIIALAYGHRRVAVITIAAALGWLVVVVGFVMPALNGGDFAQSQRFSQYGGDTSEILRFLAHHPWRVVSDLSTMQNLTLVLALLVPLSLLPLVGWRIVLAIVPIEWALLLTNQPTAHLVRYHYTAAATGVLLAAAAIGLGAVVRSRVLSTTPLVVIVLIVAGLGWVWWSELGRVYGDRQWRNSSAIEDARKHALDRVPSHAPVAVSSELADAFSGRQFVYTFPQPFDYWREPKHTGHTVDDRVAAIDWVVVDTNSAWVWPGDRDHFVNGVLPNRGFHQVSNEAGVLVFARR